MTPSNAPVFESLTLSDVEHDFFARTGPLPEGWESRRVSPRFYRRGYAVLEYPGSLPGLTRPPRRYLVLTRDLSRTGLALLHGEQLFPGEVFRIQLSEAILKTIEVMWCRRVKPGCYAAGARFV